MRRILYIFIFAVVVLIVKAFYFDKYIDEFKNGESNITAEQNASSEPNTTLPSSESQKDDTNVSDSASQYEKFEKKKMPLDELGDKISEHIKL